MFPQRIRIWLAVLLLSAVLTQTGWAIVLHPSGEPITAPEGIDLDILGTWESNASVIAIGPNMILTTRHQLSGVGADVVIAGQNYTVESETILSPQVDLRVATISGPGGQPANLTSYIPLYSRRQERLAEVVILGSGRTRGQTLTDSDSEPYGYEWSSLRDHLWGTNIVNGNRFITSSGFTSEVIEAYFDAPGSIGATPYEATLALFDSGGGWLIEDRGTWKLAGLNAYLPDYGDHPLESWFSPPERLSAIRVSSYSDEIAAALQNWAVPPGDANWDARVDQEDLAILKANYGTSDLTATTWWKQGDFNGDQAVDFADYALLATWFGTDWTTPTSVSATNASLTAIPEPATLCFLLAGAAMSLCPKRPRRNSRQTA